MEALKTPACLRAKAHGLLAEGARLTAQGHELLGEAIALERPEPAADATLTEAEAAALLRLTRWTLSRWRQHGEGPTHLKLGGRIVYRRSDLEAFMAARQQEPMS